MGRPTTKSDLIITSNGQFEKLWKLIDEMSDELQNTRFSDDMAFAGKEAHWKRDKNIRDVLVHLYEWHQLLLNWIKNNIKGANKSFLPEQYNWKTYSLMNIEFWRNHQNTLLEQSKKMLKDSHIEVMNLIERFSNEELFAKGIFDWTGTSTLGAYCVSATVSHYDWAMKKIKLHIKKSK